MIIFPAIDIKGGKVVRLFQGKFSDVTEYGDDPVAMALKWEAMGAQWLHLVDLDGAKDGLMINREVIAKIAKTVKIPVEVGGGIRDEKTVDYLINTAKVARVILGTSVLELGDSIRGSIKAGLMLQESQKLGGEKITVSIDCLNGCVARRGWTETSSLKGVELARMLYDLGIKVIIYTDIARDGTLAGPNFDELRDMLNQVKGINLIASGGVSNIEDIKKLCDMSKEFNGRLIGAITGKAIYEGKLDFKKAVELCR